MAFNNAINNSSNTTVGVSNATSAQPGFPLALPGTFGRTFATTQTIPADATSLASGVCYLPFFAPNTYTSTSLNFYVATSAASSSINFGIYKSNVNNGYPKLSTAPLVTANVATTSNGLKSPSLVYTFDKDVLYWMGVQFSTATTLALVAAPFNVQTTGGCFIISASFSPTVLQFPTTYSAGVFPNTPTIASTYLGVIVHNFPVFTIL